MADLTRSDTSSSSSLSRTMRSQKITRPEDGSQSLRNRASSKSQGVSGPAMSDRHWASDPPMRPHSHSISKAPYGTPSPSSTPVPMPSLPVRRKPDARDDSSGESSTSAKDTAPPRPSASSTTAPSATPSLAGSLVPAALSQHLQTVRSTFPPIQDPLTAADVPPAPSSGMYWLRAPVSGHRPVQAHTTTLLGNSIYVFGGCDNRACFSDLYVLDADAFHWSKPQVRGDIPSPLRGMTCTAVGKKLVLFGGGDGPGYYNDVYVLDTVNFRWHKPRIVGDQAPSVRGAHTACLYKNGIYVFGGGDGNRPLNDIWRLDVSDMGKMSWRLICGPDTNSNGAGGGDGNAAGTGMAKPKARGYHTANMIGNKLIIYGGSTATERFNDVWVYDVDTQVWKNVKIPVPFRRVTHTSTLVGSYLFIIGGHDGRDYSDEVLLFNLVTMSWDKRHVYGLPPSGRGYHGTVLHDSRLLVIGGFDGETFFDEVWILELAVHAYYSQISHFNIVV